jgi:diguanylate cyclase (GGDEF)-like protein
VRTGSRAVSPGAGRPERRRRPTPVVVATVSTPAELGARPVTRETGAVPGPRRRVALVVRALRSTRKIILRMLNGSGLFDVILEADDAATALMLAAGHVDLVLCDLDLPGGGGLAFLDRFRADPGNATIPVLMLMGRGTDEQRAEGLRHGANDYLIEPCTHDEMCARVGGYLRMKLLLDELKGKNRELELLSAELARTALTDPLTGIDNRRHFMHRAQEELKRARRYERSFSLLMIDVDHFKRINDDFGHTIGDQVLVALAATIHKALRETDMLARYGGEELIIGLTETGREGALVVAERLRRLVASTSIAGLERRVTISVGVAALGKDVESVEQLIERADAALYRAKREGRDRVAVDPAL